MARGVGVGEQGFVTMCSITLLNRARSLSLSVGYKIIFHTSLVLFIFWFFFSFCITPPYLTQLSPLPLSPFLPSYTCMLLSSILEPLFLFLL